MSNVTKVWSYGMLVLLNGIMKLSNVRKKKRELPNVTSMVICDVGTSQCDNGIVKCEEKIKVPLNVRKVQ